MKRTGAEMQDEEDKAELGCTSLSAANDHRAWTVGKKVAIAGAAITSAPILVPPLVVLSALGLTFSFSYGIYLAGYACTDKVMSALLPLPSSKEDDEAVEGVVKRHFDIIEKEELPIESVKQWEKVAFKEEMANREVDRVSTSTASNHRVWSISKKVAIAGAAITSAPFVIPPLVVLSAVGLAFSFPYGIYLVGYACTNKVMSTLLPLSSSKEEVVEVTSKPENAVDKPSDTVEENDLKVPESRSEEETLAIQCQEKDLGTSAVADEIGNNNYSTREVIPGEEQEEEVQEDESPGSEINESPKSPYSEVLVVPDKESNREDEAPNLNQELKKDTSTVVNENRNNNESAQEVTEGAEQVEEVQNVASPASEINGSPKSPYSVALMAPNEGTNREHEPESLNQEQLSFVQIREEDKFKHTSFDKIHLKEMIPVRKEEEEEQSHNSAVTRDNASDKSCNSQVEPHSLKTGASCQLGHADQSPTQPNTFPTVVSSPPKKDAEGLDISWVHGAKKCSKTKNKRHTRWCWACWKSPSSK